MRLDVWLVEKGLISSRARAQKEIRAGRIKVNQQVVKKPAYMLTTTDTVESLTPFNPYVSVGGLKLEAALRTFEIDVHNLTILDVGASTGGFTDCVLKQGARKVIAVDVGRDQMVQKLAEDPRVTLYESMHFLNTDATFFSGVDLLVMDVSFIASLTLIAHAVKFYQGPMLVLFKPQFASPETPKSGVVRDKKQHIRLLKQFESALRDQALYLSKLMPSPIKGGSGNIEFLCFITPSNSADINILDIVEKAHAMWQ